MNRYSQYSTSQFNPLSLEEIMAIPIAKQQQHDAFLQGAEQLNALDYNRLPGDNAISEKELQAYRDEVNSYVEELYKTGINRNLTNKLQQLKRTYDKNMSPSGKWGKRVANYEAVKNWRDEIFKDKNLSMDEAQRLFNLKSNGFVTDNPDGTTNYFQGTYAPEDFDKIKVIDDAIAGISPDKYDIVDKNGNPIQRVGNLSAFTNLYRTGVIDEWNYYKGVSAINAQLVNNPEIAKRLQFEALLNGQDPNKALNFFDTKINEDGQEVYDFDKPLNSMGAMIAAKASGKSYKNTTYNYIKDEDEVGLEQLKDQMARAREKDANGMQLISGEGRYNILASFNGVADVQNKINDLKKAGDAESLKTAHQYEEALFQAQQQFNKNNESLNSKIDTFTNTLRQKGVSEQDIQDLLHLHDPGSLLSGGSRFNISKDSKTNKLQIDIFVKDKWGNIKLSHRPLNIDYNEFIKLKPNTKVLDEYNKGLDNYLKDYQIDTSNIYLGMGKNSEQYTKYGSEMLTRALNMNDITIDNVVYVGADGKQKMLKLNDKDRTNIINQISGGDINIVSFNDMQGQAKNKLIVQIKGKNGEYKRVSLNMQDLYDKNTGLMTASGNLLYNLGKMSDTQGQQTINKFIQNQQYSSVVVGHENENKKDFYSDPFLKDIISQKLPSSITKQYDVNLQQDSSGNYKIQMKNKLWDTDKDPKRTSKDKGTVRNMTWGDLTSSNISPDKISQNIKAQMIKDLYPTLQYNDALQKLLSDPTFDIKYEEYLDKPLQSTDKNVLLNLFN